MDAFDFIQRIEGAGFTLALAHGNLAVTPASDLNDRQREFIRSHRDELVAALRSSETLLDSEGGNDLAAANDRTTIHVPEYESASGNRYSFDMTVPTVNLPALKRTSLKFMLKDAGGGGSLLGSPGRTEDELRDVLCRMYGDRLQSINGSAP